MCILYIDSLSHPIFHTLCQIFRRFLGAYIIFVMSVRLSAWKESAPLDRLPRNFMFEYFSKICRENLSFVKI
jgi:hypothetical protein